VPALSERVGEGSCRGATQKNAPLQAIPLTSSRPLVWSQNLLRSAEGLPLGKCRDSAERAAKGLPPKMTLRKEQPSTAGVLHQRPAGFYHPVLAGCATSSRPLWSRNRPHRLPWFRRSGEVTVAPREGRGAVDQNVAGGRTVQGNSASAGELGHTVTCHPTSTVQLPARPGARSEWRGTFARLLIPGLKGPARRRRWARYRRSRSS
jgi:hypothetical protein